MTKTIKKKIIMVPKGNVIKIAKANGVSMTMVYQALNYNSNSENATAIRRSAIREYGGIETTKTVLV